MWQWLLSVLVPILVDAAIRFGEPLIAEWVLKKLPAVPKALIDYVMNLINKAIEDITGYHPSSPQAMAVRSLAKREAKQCVGAFCSAQPKGLD